MANATFDGIDCFGNPTSFTAKILDTGKASAIDSWLSLSPGTTEYGLQAGGRFLIGITGTLIGQTAAAVNYAYASLAGMAGNTGPFAMPTGVTLEGGIQGVNNVFFASTDIVGGSVTGSGTAYQQTYSLVLRVL